MVLTASQDAFTETYENTGIGPLGGQSARIVQVAVGASESDSATFARPVTPGNYLMIFARDWYNAGGYTGGYTGDHGFTGLSVLAAPGIFGPMVLGGFVSDTGVTDAVVSATGGGGNAEVVALELAGVHRTTPPTASTSGVTATAGQLVIGATDAKPATVPDGWNLEGQRYDAFNPIGVTVASTPAALAGTYSFGTTVVVPSAEADVTRGANTETYENTGLGPFGVLRPVMNRDYFTSQPAGTVVPGHTLSNGSGTWRDRAGSTDFEYVGDGTIRNLNGTLSTPISEMTVVGSADGQVSVVLGPVTTGSPQGSRGLMFRIYTSDGIQPPSGRWMLTVAPDGTGSLVRRFNFGDSENFGAGSAAWTCQPGQRLRAIFAGTRLDVYVDESLVSTYTLTSFQSDATNVGIFDNTGVDRTSYMAGFEWSSSILPPGANVQDAATETYENTGLGVAAALSDVTRAGFTETYEDIQPGLTTMTTEQQLVATAVIQHRVIAAAAPTTEQHLVAVAVVPTPPANDEIANAAVFVNDPTNIDNPVRVNANNRYATAGSDDPPDVSGWQSPAVRSMWWRWVPAPSGEVPADADILIATVRSGPVGDASHGPNLDSVLFVYERNTDGTPGAFVTYNDDDNSWSLYGNASRATWTPVFDREYLIAVTPYDDGPSNLQYNDDPGAMAANGNYYYFGAFWLEHFTFAAELLDAGAGFAVIAPHLAYDRSRDPDVLVPDSNGAGMPTQEALGNVLFIDFDFGNGVLVGGDLPEAVTIDDIAPAPPELLGFTDEDFGTDEGDLDEPIDESSGFADDGGATDDDSIGGAP